MQHWSFVVIFEEYRIFSYVSSVFSFASSDHFIVTFCSFERQKCMREWFYRPVFWFETMKCWKQNEANEAKLKTDETKSKTDETKLKIL